MPRSEPLMAEPSVPLAEPSVPLAEEGPVREASDEPVTAAT
jgi:hypothetical protein